jgi:hypothetical protein
MTATASNWKALPGWEGFYEVSDTGQVRSVDRSVPYGKHGHSKYKGRTLTPYPTPKGYRQVRLTRKGKSIQRYVHALVLAAFVGPRPKDAYETCHKNQNKEDNRLENLRYCTTRENALHRTRGTLP